MDGPTKEINSYTMAQRVGLFCGPIAMVVLLSLPEPAGMSPEAMTAAAVAALMATWWMTEAIPIPATALLPLVLFPVLGVLSAGEAAEPYANELIFLFMGGFFIAVTMERWSLHRRIALSILRVVGTTPDRLVLGFMLATGFLSMWISNTATAAMMLPIGVAVGRMLMDDSHKDSANFGVALMLGIAYSASIGGVATLIGTPPNAVFAGAAQELLGVRIGFIEWMCVGLPIVAMMLPMTWFLLTKVLHRSSSLFGDAESIIASERRQLGSMLRGEKITATVFALTAAAWVFRSEKTFGNVVVPGLQSLSPYVTDATIAIAAALLLFCLPASFSRGQFTLDWPTARKIPWGVLVLFGGGLSLARAMDRSGLAAWIGSAISDVGHLPVLLIVGAVALLVIFLTEVTSNTATATMAMPIMAGTAVLIGIDPLLLMSTAAMAASMAFMLPVATPPNAIVFGSEFLTISQMARAGLLLNILSVMVVSLLGSALIPLILTR